MKPTHFANAFSLTPGRCFRMATLPGVGHPSHCSEPVAWHGRWRAADNRLYRVDACEATPMGLGHRSVTEPRSFNLIKTTRRVVGRNGIDGRRGDAGRVIGRNLMW
jgi:hypothetical protein